VKLELSTDRIRAVAFDAVGTLIEPFPPVAEAYRQTALVHGLDLPAARIRSRFLAAFSTDEAADDHRTNEAAERTRWRSIVGKCLPELTVDQADDAFERLWIHFADPANWRLFDDVEPVIQAFAARGLGLCIASNFDSRLRNVWRGLASPGLPLNHLVISSEAGVRKPGSMFYDAVTAVLECGPQEILFVGDDPANDFRLPQEKGFQAVLLDRRGRFGQSGSISRLTDLLPLFEPVP
jgi:putative hydrolase of the HAD superfamily